ncbi:protein DETOXIFICATION 16-like isoform X2 [Gossypium australe]|uniref:Protein DETOXIFICATION 16-like isoform X2 n=1 Tax=Gossypium australe TaxID=47621 RepID=A0A5B6USL1_9ROSI|nr:protein DETOXIFICATION 16-like isoform X2 [Gossypium australe]
MVLSSGITTLIHVFICWILVFKLSFGNKGAALAGSISYWINVLMLAFYIKFSPSCVQTWTGFSNESLYEVLPFLRLAVPSAVMVCLESWSFQILVFLSGLLPNPELETSVITICINTTAIILMIPFGLSSAASIRVSNELGAEDPKGARLAVRVVLVLGVSQGILVGLALVLMRNVLGYAYSNDASVIRYVSTMVPILAASNIIDGVQSTCLKIIHFVKHLGIVRGCGWQKIGAYINLGSYYLVGIPLSIVLAFVFHIGVMGLWLGITAALTTQMLFLLIITARSNLEQEVKCTSIPFFFLLFHAMALGKSKKGYGKGILNMEYLHVRVGTFKNRVECIFCIIGNAICSVFNQVLTRVHRHQNAVPPLLPRATAISSSM